MGSIGDFVKVEYRYAIQKFQLCEFFGWSMEYVESLPVGKVNDALNYMAGKSKGEAGRRKAESDGD